MARNCVNPPCVCGTTAPTKENTKENIQENNLSNLANLDTYLVVGFDVIDKLSYVLTIKGMTLQSAETTGKQLCENQFIEYVGVVHFPAHISTKVRQERKNKVKKLIDLATARYTYN